MYRYYFIAQDRKTSVEFIRTGHVAMESALHSYHDHIARAATNDITGFNLWIAKGQAKLYFREV